MEAELERCNPGAVSWDAVLGAGGLPTISLDLLCDSTRACGSMNREKGATCSVTSGEEGDESVTDVSASVEVATETAEANELYEFRRARPANGRNAFAKNWPMRARGPRGTANSIGSSSSDSGSTWIVVFQRTRSHQLGTRFLEDES